MSADKESLVESFQRYFKVELATTEAQKKQIYGIRYRVYCDEFKYESVEKYPEKEEKDEYDDCSLHCLIVHRTTLKPGGCVRLVPAITESGENIQLPFEKYCPDSLDVEFIKQLHLDRQTVCEISRLAVDRVFRRRTGEELTRFGELEGLDFSKQEQRTFSLIAVAAFLSATVLTEISGKTNVFAMMEPFLPRLLKRSGIIFRKSGQDVDYHGIRAPYFVQTQSALESMNTDLKDLYDWIYRQLKS